MGSNLYSPVSIPFLYYDCLQQFSCSDCVDVLKPDCSWCFESAQCSSSTCIGLEQDICPSLLSLIPASSLLQQQLTVTIIGTYFPQGINYECLFGSVSSSAQWVNNTSLECDVPNTLALGSYFVKIFHSGKEFSFNSLRFVVFDCQVQSCRECLDPSLEGGCQWCIEDNLCGVNPSCTLGETISTCPCKKIFVFSFLF